MHRDPPPPDVPSPESPVEFERQAHAAPAGLVREFVDFLRTSKKWWLLPILLLVLGLAAFLVASGTVAAPWLYTLF